MNKVRILFNEVKFELLKVSLMNSFLDALMMFFLIYFVISLFNVKLEYALTIPGIISFIFFVATFIKRTQNSRLKDMEKANPQLREILRTAHDNQEEDNILVQALFRDLKEKLRNASSGNLIDSKKITTRVISAITIVFLILFLSTVTINIQKIDIPFDKLKFLTDLDAKERTEGNITELVFNQTDVIYGDASIAKLGNDVVNIKVNPTIGEIDLTKTSEVEEKELVSGAIPQEISISSDAYSNQQILEEAEAAVNYSQRISKIS
ncbi:hypothetical protein JW711_03735 [Candidatus Woesearchaeota archaeon]|nr:hypothetical protein [Candidatus Woesearchaeota archaeon]